MRRSLVFLLTLIFVFTIVSGPAAPKANAVVVSSIVVGTVIAAMAASGIGIAVSGMTSVQLSDWVSGKLNDWTTSIGGSVQDHIDNNLITVTARGIISIGNQAAKGISDFINWLISADNIQSNQSSTVVNYTAVVKMDSDANYQICQVGERFYTLKPIYVPTYVTTCYDSQSHYGGPLVATTQQASYVLYRSRNGYPIGPGDGVVNVTIETSIYDDATGLYYNKDYWDWVRNETGINSNTNVYIGIRAALDAIKSGITNDSFGELLEYKTGVISVPTIDTTTQDKWFLDVGAEPGTTVETAADGVIADTIAGDLTVSGEVAEEEPEFVVDEPIAVSGLTEVFPFCIPFDIYALLSSLSADPQTPVFTARFVVPGIIDEEFTIDLTPFNSVAQIVRTLELLAFIIGLALVTRERFLRS